MRESDFDVVLKEYFDTNDRKTMKTLLSLNEADQNQAMVALATKLYEKIVAKVDDIDFGTIPASKGDITKIGNFMEMRDCMNTIREILVHYKQDTAQLDIIDNCELCCILFIMNKNIINDTNTFNHFLIITNLSNITFRCRNSTEINIINFINNFLI